MKPKLLQGGSRLGFCGHLQVSCLAYRNLTSRNFGFQSKPGFVRFNPMPAHIAERILRGYAQFFWDFLAWVPWFWRCRSEGWLCSSARCCISSLFAEAVHHRTRLLKKARSGSDGIFASCAEIKPMTIEGRLPPSNTSMIDDGRSTCSCSRSLTGRHPEAGIAAAGGIAIFGASVVGLFAILHFIGQPGGDLPAYRARGAVVITARWRSAAHAPGLL
jgi:hypothetical protein